MASVDSLSLDSLRRSTAVCEDVWFLSGPMGPGDTLQHTPIDQEPFIVGRKSGVAMKLQFRTVSGNHAELKVEDGKLMVRDLESTNGTYLNGERVEGTAFVGNEDLIHFAEAPFRVRRQSPTGVTAGTISENVCDQALALVQFDRLMSQRLVRPHFQPIVTLSGARQVGFEILGRGSVFGLESVGAMFHAAEQLNLEVELSRMLRWEGLREGREIPDSPTLFVNTHPKEMEDTQSLIDSLCKVRSMASNTQIVLEIHESAVTNPKQMQRLHATLKELNMQLAYDDFGAGQARLAELVEARPDYVKFDIGLIRGLSVADENRMRMLRSLVSMVQDLDISALAEGIETIEEAEACQEIGFDLAQGFYYGRPAPA
ncbi:EAL domain-containing protein [Rhodopirellula sp. JC740]|uniref:EAL domain-containing protein n=1 Tax=Rhodopirellula halodulae TaxID=2894198 RepID=A0ABS8NLI3_9BACT|nr:MULTISPECIES: EAL domain-containing protein [unclassified Rhodopirellula]MCC9644427.1 EAL domain-containing protein [Rhodopirellula sp. JC740]MCC9655850.1 EAL domain-containing protein [Rhodopirellula sp. JC737]